MNKHIFIILSIFGLFFIAQESVAVPGIKNNKTTNSSYHIKVLNLNGLNAYRLKVINKGDVVKQKIIGSTYNYDVFGTNMEGEKLWQDKTGGFCFDICTGDIIGDESEEVILGCADDSVYCYNSKGDRLWTTGLQSGPVFSVAHIKSEGENYILAGTVLNYVFVINTEGAIISKHKFDGAIRELLVYDFDRNGTEDVYLNRAYRDNEQYGNIYAFPSFAPISSFSEVELGLNRSDHGQNALLYTKENGEALIFDDKGFIDPLDGMKRVTYSNSGFSIEKDDYASGYRAKYLSCGNYLLGSDEKQVAMVYGDDVFLYSSSAQLLAYRRTNQLSFNDVTTVSESGQDKMLLAGAPNGDDNLYLISPDNSSEWLTELAQRDWSGQMKSISDAYSNIQTNINNWAGVAVDLPSDKPIIIQVNGTQGNGLNDVTMEDWISIWKNELAYYNQKFPYPDRIKFAFRVQLYENWTGYFQYQNPDGTWVTEAEKGLSKETLLTFARRMEEEGIPFYSKAHGIQVSLDTYKAMMDVAPNAYLGVGIVEYGFAYSPFEVNEKGKQDFFIRDFMLPLMDYAKEKGKNVWFHNKGAVWAVRSQMSWMQSGIISEKYKDVLIMSNEDSNSRTPDLNTAGRVGAWYAGYVNNWGYRWVSDIPAYSRLWDWSRVNTGHPASRSLLTAVSLGANYLNICSRQYNQQKREEMHSMSTGVEQFIHLLGKGIIAPPQRENLLNISPVTLTLKEELVPEAYWTSGGHDFNTGSQTHKGYIQADGFGLLSKMGVEWGSATTPKTDWAAYTYGRYQQTHNHIPNLGHGYGYAPIIGKPNNRSDIDISYFTTQIESDGETASIDDEVLSLSQTKERVLEAMSKGTEDIDMFPVIITGEVFSSVNRIAEDHYLLYLVDPNLMSPGGDCLSSITANKEGEWSVKDRISNEEIGTLNPTMNVIIPAGAFRILEIKSDTNLLAKSEVSENKIRIYPNPVINELNVFFPNDIESSKLVVYSLSGEKVSCQELENKNTCVDFRSCQPGAYLLHFSLKNSFEVHKVIKY